MDNPINFFFVQSLQQIAVTKVVGTLWNLENIRLELSKCYYSRSSLSMFENVVSMVRNKVETLEVPIHVKKKILCHVRHIGICLWEWVRRHCDSILNDRFPDIYLPREFFWTSIGAINEKETAKLFIEDESLSIITRYKLACTYCLLSDIPVLWSKLPDNLRYAQKNYPSYEALVAFWTHQTGGSQTPKITSGHAFDFAVSTLNKPATEYHMQNLSSEQRESLLVITACKVLDTNNFSHLQNIEVLCYLVSHMDIHQQIEFFNKYAYIIFFFFLTCPDKSFYLEVVRRLLGCLSEKRSIEFWEEMADYFDDSSDISIYSQLFTKVWQMTYALYKKYSTNKSFPFSRFLYDQNGLKFIQLIFSHLSMGEKIVIFSHHGNYICEVLLECDKWYELKDFLFECLNTVDEHVKFKNSVKAYADRQCYQDGSFRSTNTSWKRLFTYLNKMIHPFGPRSYFPISKQV